MPRPNAGLEEFTMNGEVWTVTKSSWRSARAKRDMLESQTNFGDYSEKPMRGHISVSVRAQPGQDVDALADVVGGTGVLVQKNGTTVYGSDLKQTGEADTDTATGETDLVFEGNVTTAVAA